MHIQANSQANYLLQFNKGYKSTGFSNLIQLIATQNNFLVAWCQCHAEITERLVSMNLIKFIANW